MNAQLGSDGRLTLSGCLLNQLDLSGFAWRAKNSLLDGSTIQKMGLYGKKKKLQNIGRFLKTSCLLA
jgi:hypothetical protein